MAGLADETRARLLGRGHMILVTIGTMLPFDRLVRAADAWAAENPDANIFAQIGDKGAYEPRHMRWTRLLSPQEFTALASKSRLLVAHAGTGSFFLAAELGLPIVLFPRQAKWKEHNTDHQVDTARWLGGRPGVHVAMTEQELPGAIAAALAKPDAAMDVVPPFAPAPFLAQIRSALLT